MKHVAMRTMKMRRSCRRLDGQVQCGGNDGGGLRGTLGSRHTFSDDTRPHYSHHSARALPISKSQNGRSMCDASPGDDRDGARSTRSCPIHLPLLQLYAEILRRSRGDVTAYIDVFASIIPESCAFSGRPRAGRECPPRPPGGAPTRRVYRLLIATILDRLTEAGHAQGSFT